MCLLFSLILELFNDLNGGLPVDFTGPVKLFLQPVNPIFQPPVNIAFRRHQAT
jgi:hypothetical protein